MSNSSTTTNETSVTTQESTSSFSTTVQSEDKDNIGLIVGCAVGGFVFLLLIIITTVLIVRWRKRKTRRRKSPAPLPDLRAQSIEPLDKSTQGSPSTTSTTSEQHSPRASHNNSFGVDTDMETSRDSLNHLPDISKTDLPNHSSNWNITSGPLINKAISESNINRTPRNQPLISTSDENSSMDYMDMNSNSIRPFAHKFHSQRYVNLQNNTSKLDLSSDTSHESLGAKESPKKSKTKVQDSLEEDIPQEDYINMSNELFHKPTDNEIKAEKSSKLVDHKKNNEDIMVEEGQQDSYINMAEIDIKPPTLLSVTDTRQEVSSKADTDMKYSNESTDDDEPQDYINLETVVIPFQGESNTQVLKNRSDVSSPHKQEISPKPSNNAVDVSSPLNKDNHPEPSNIKSIGPQFLNQNNSSLTSLNKSPAAIPSNKKDSLKTSDTVSRVPTLLKQEKQASEKNSNISSSAPERNQIPRDEADSSDSEPLEDYVNVEEKFQPPHLSNNSTQNKTIPQNEILKESSSSNSLPGLKQAPPTLPKSKAAKNISEELVKTKPNSNKINSHKQQTITEVQEDNSIYENAKEKPPKNVELLMPQSNFKDNAGKISPKLNALLSNSKGMQRKPPAVSPKPK